MDAALTSRSPGRREGRDGLTLLEILVTMVVASGVLVAAGLLYAGAASDFTLWSAVREKRFSTLDANMEIPWTVCRIAPESYRQSATLWNQATVTWVDSSGQTQTRTVVTYDYTKSLNLGAVLASQDVQESWTGIIFQFGTIAYRYESRTADLGSSFNTWSTSQLQTFCADPAKQALSDILGIGVDTLNFQPDFTNPPGVYVTCTLTFLP